MPDNKIGGGWRISAPYSQSRQSEYVKGMAEALNAIPRQKIPPTTTQCKSTQELLDAQATRTPSADAAYIKEKRDRDFPAHTQIRDEKGDIFTNERQIPYDQVLVFKENRSKGRNTLGEPKESSLSPERRDRGIFAFTYSKPAKVSEKDLKRLTKMDEMEAVSPTEIPKDDEQPIVRTTFIDWVRSWQIWWW